MAGMKKKRMNKFNELSSWFFFSKIKNNRKFIVNINLKN